MQHLKFNVKENTRFLLYRIYGKRRAVCYLRLTTNDIMCMIAQKKSETPENGDSQVFLLSYAL